MQSFFHFSSRKFLLAIAIALLPITGRVIASFAIPDIFTPFSTPYKISYAITILQYMAYAPFVPFDLIVGRYLLLFGANLFGESFFLEGIKPLFVIYLPYILLYTAYSYLVASLAIFAIATLLRRNSA